MRAINRKLGFEIAARAAITRSSDSASSVETSTTRSSAPRLAHAVVEHDRAERAGDGERLGAGLGRLARRAPR